MYSVDADTVTIDYDAFDEDCEWLGYELSGFQTITVLRAEEDDVRVEHSWDDLSDGSVRLDGNAEVRWSEGHDRRQMRHDLRWTSISDGRTGEGSGGRLQRPLPEGIEEGLRLDGEHDWDGDDGQWLLEGHDLEMRWGDPIPQAGHTHLDTPYGEAVTLQFFRIDDRTVKVRVESGYRRFFFRVSQRGSVFYDD